MLKYVIVYLIHCKSNVEFHRFLYLALYCLFYILMIFVSYKKYLVVFFLLIMQTSFILLMTSMIYLE